ncbi:MAG: hypothetical protein AB7J35_12890 [Dehalococcoidia bacterium]
MSQQWWYLAIGLFVAVLAILAGIAIYRSQRERSSTFVGKYSYGFEVSSFVPCNSPDVKYWLVWQKPIDLTSEMQKAGANGFGSEVYLKFEGKLETGGDGYGHLGQYTGQLEITKLVSVARESLCE